MKNWKRSKYWIDKSTGMIFTVMKRKLWFKHDGREWMLMDRGRNITILENDIRNGMIVPLLGKGIK